MKRHILIITILFICIMLLANTIVKTIFLNENNVVSKLDTFKALDKDYVYGGSVNVKSMNNITQMIHITGYAFIPTIKNNNHRYTNVYLISDKHIYKLKSYANFVWLFENFKYLYLNSTRYGFSSDFSAINIKNGTYKIFLETYENDENYGYIYTHKLLHKNGINIEFLDDKTIAKQVEMDKLGGNISYAIDNIKKEGDKIYFGGWAFHNKACGNVYMAFKNKNGDNVYYKTVKGIRYDIGNYLKNSSYNCGWYMYIGYDTVKEYTLSSIILEQNGKFYKTDIKEQNVKQYHDVVTNK